MQGVQRKPWGQGKAAQQKYRRNALAFSMSELLMDRLDMDKVRMTGQLVPRGDLKKETNRTLFDWVNNSQFNGRTFTKPVLRLVIRKLMRNITFPLDPENKNFVAQQAKRLRTLIRSAKRLKESFQKHTLNIAQWGQFKLRITSWHVFQDVYIHTYSTYIYMYTYMYVCIYICVCVFQENM